MKAQLLQELEMLKEAFKNKLLTTNEYSSAYHALSQRIKKYA
jgi:hypothetical protein